MLVDCSYRGSIATIRLNRPDKLNAINEEMKSDLLSHFHRLANEDEVRAVLVTGAGKSFCAGGDINTMGNFTAQSLRKRLEATHAVMEAVHTVQKPVVAALNGAVAGIGLSLALACDYLIAAESTYFTLSFKNIGVVPDGGALYFLYQNIGMIRTKELVFSARKVPAAEALELGLLSKVVADTELQSRATEIAEELASGPTLALGLTKRLMLQMQPSMTSFFDAEVWAQTPAVLSKDHREGTRAFFEKRKPVFSGQ